MYTYIPSAEHQALLDAKAEEAGVQVERVFGQIVFSALEQLLVQKQMDDAKYLRELSLKLPPESQALVAALILEEAAKLP